MHQLCRNYVYDTLPLFLSFGCGYAAHLGRCCRLSPVSTLKNRAALKLPVLFDTFSRKYPLDIPAG